MNAEVRPIRTAAETGLIDAFERARSAQAGGEAARAIREEAFSGVVARGLPNRRVEEWKYTDLRALMREAQPIAEGATEADVSAARSLLPLQEVDALRLVFVNGAFAELLSAIDAPQGVTITPFAHALQSDARAALTLAGAPQGDAAVALNTAFVTSGVTITVAAGTKVARPIHIANVQTGPGHAAYGRVLVTIGEGAEATLIESFSGDSGGHQVNSTVGLTLGDDSKATLIKLQDEGFGTLHLATLAATLGARAELKTVALTAGAAASRQQIYLGFKGAKATADLTGAGFAGARRHLDTTLVVEHDAVGCTSRETFKTALDGEARSVFQGKIVVRPGAQKTDGKMMAKALLLSEGAEADAKPELEIFADDVVCGHGATVGALDDELLFYLMSRGLPKVEAEALLVQAFVGEVLESIEIEPLREALVARSERWLVARD
ncbi:Fe-S cluster assembly protein SufD [Hansschlegelia quercus]|uniref:Fe-S cluster assembly protein SufD n=1 Tax=Hansschlegelia quercus TaxID=2528245 RepID=A0A4V2JE72_9HYPH|nr:Fe-S cluster assembly protein SufD [Hansschlegelia quercus]TBN54116.1 Fe-S cluster assembly protein SufD [Hansschlegelia quercus]